MSKMRMEQILRQERAQLKRVTGIGGIFFKFDDQEKLYQWHEKHLGINRALDGTGAAFEWRDLEDAKNKGMTVWRSFPRQSKYFDPRPSPFMINYRADDLDALRKALQEEGVEIDPHREDYEYGRFAWIMDLDGNRIELWEPPKESKP